MRSFGFYTDRSVTFFTSYSVFKVQERLPAGPPADAVLAGAVQSLTSAPERIRGTGQRSIPANCKVPQKKPGISPGRCPLRYSVYYLGPALPVSFKFTYLGLSSVRLAWR
jgi:hypothetical protein